MKGVPDEQDIGGRDRSSDPPLVSLQRDDADLAPIEGVAAESAAWEKAIELPRLELEPRSRFEVPRHEPERNPLTARELLENRLDARQDPLAAVLHEARPEPFEVAGLQLRVAALVFPRRDPGARRDLLEDEEIGLPREPDGVEVLRHALASEDEGESFLERAPAGSVRVDQRALCVAHATSQRASKAGRRKR